VIAPHYAEPLPRLIGSDAVLHSAPSADADVLDSIPAGEPFLMLDDSLGWAWGYAGAARRVGYLRSDSLAS
jgi:hypothetical protein